MPVQFRVHARKSHPQGAGEVPGGRGVPSGRLPEIGVDLLALGASAHKGLPHVQAPQSSS